MLTYEQILEGLQDLNFQLLRDVFAGTLSQEQRTEFWGVITEAEASIKSFMKNQTVPREEYEVRMGDEL
jgi:hypothetical protein